jgi:NNP family nitrate/nitrite transporter-like MFS transporter
MHDIASAKASFSDQLVIFKRKHNWLMSWLYLGTFGSFIGFSAGFALLTKKLFPGIDPTAYAFLGPFVGAVARLIGGWISDKLGGARVTFWTFIGMVLAVIGVLSFIPHGGQVGNFQFFLIMFLLLFTLTGVGNASIFRMIPVIYILEHQRVPAERSDGQINIDAAKEAAAALGFAGALGAYGGFFIPKSFGTSIAATGTPDAALYGFIIFYLSCIIITWWYYSRKNAEMPC